MRKVCVVIGSRANYSSIKSVLTAISSHPKLHLQIVTVASAVLDRFGDVSNLMESDGFNIDERLYTYIEGESPALMAKTTGLSLIELSSAFLRLTPDIVLTVGDRFETMATTLAATYMNIPLAHTMGGELSGTIDESIRHATTKFAHIHFPATEGAAKVIAGLGESPEAIFPVGCPRIDLIKEIAEKEDSYLFSYLTSEGVGIHLDSTKPFLIVSQHPVTTEFDQSADQILETLKAVRKTNLQAIVLWPNSDAGSDSISRSIRKFRESNSDLPFRFFKNLPVEIYITLLKKTQCLVGNSSSGIREALYIGTPVVNIGTRQDARERGDNTISCRHNSDDIFESILFQINHGPYEPNYLYGNGNAGIRIANVLAECSWSLQKHLFHSD